MGTKFAASGGRPSAARTMQIFSPGALIALKLGSLGATAIVVASVLTWRAVIAQRPAVGAPVEQLVPFSHKHHVGDDGLDCRYCHSTVETSAFAGIPPLSTCMTCHSQLFTDAPVLEWLRKSYSEGRRLSWNRVHELPGFVYFDHSIHVAKGVGCSTCHGQVDTMPLTYRVASLKMQWCLECHREPERQLRPLAEVFDMSWRPPPDQIERGRELRARYHIHSTDVLTACSTCHR